MRLCDGIKSAPATAETVTTPSKKSGFNMISAHEDWKNLAHRVTPPGITDWKSKACETDELDAKLSRSNSSFEPHRLRSILYGTSSSTAINSAPSAPTRSLTQRAPHVSNLTGRVEATAAGDSSRRSGKDLENGLNVVCQTLDSLHLPNEEENHTKQNTLQSRNVGLTTSSLTNKENFRTRESKLHDLPVQISRNPFARARLAKCAWRMADSNAKVNMKDSSTVLTSASKPVQAHTTEITSQQQKTSTATAPFPAQPNTEKSTDQSWVLQPKNLYEIEDTPTPVFASPKQSLDETSRTSRLPVKSSLRRGTSYSPDKDDNPTIRRRTNHVHFDMPTSSKKSSSESLSSSSTESSSCSVDGETNTKGYTQSSYFSPPNSYNPPNSSIPSICIESCEGKPAQSNKPDIPVIVINGCDKENYRQNSSGSNSPRDLPWNAIGRNEERILGEKERIPFSGSINGQVKCNLCNYAISGRCVASLENARFHPECFICYECSQPLELVAFYCEPSEVRQERVDTAQTPSDLNPRFYCHLDYHEKFSPRCKNCKTPIEGQIIRACGAEWHVGHFFCAECGNPFSASEEFHEDGGYAWCSSCYDKRKSPRCRKCRLPIVENIIRAMESFWHKDCFACGECSSKFTDGRYFLRSLTLPNRTILEGSGMAKPSVSPSKEQYLPICFSCEQRRIVQSC